jgi:ribosomal protein S18 acetylase RimI-like enzyme
MGPAPRTATADDVPELVRLRRVMFEAMGLTVTTDDDDAVTAALQELLPTGDLFAVVVDAEDHAAACGVGMVARRLPGPGNPSGRVGYIQSMVTDERDRRQGHARRVLVALMDEFAERGVVRVDLHATEAGAALYTQHGFAPGPQPELRWKAPEP